MAKIDKEKFKKIIDDINSMYKDGFSYYSSIEIRKFIEKLQNLLINNYDESYSDLLILCTNTEGFDVEKLKEVFIKNVTRTEDVNEYRINAKNGDQIVVEIIKYMKNIKIKAGKEAKIETGFIEKIIESDILTISNGNPSCDIIESYFKKFEMFSSNPYFKQFITFNELCNFRDKLIFKYAKPFQIVSYIYFSSLYDNSIRNSWYSVLEENVKLILDADDEELLNSYQLYHLMGKSGSPVEILEKAILKKHNKDIEPNFEYYTEDFLNISGLNIDLVVDFAIDHYNAWGLHKFAQLLLKNNKCNETYFSRIEEKILSYKDVKTSFYFLYYFNKSDIKKHEEIIREAYNLDSDFFNSSIDGTNFIKLANRKGADIQLYQSIVEKYFYKFITKFAIGVEKSNKEELRDSLKNNFKISLKTKPLVDFIINISIDNTCLLECLFEDKTFSLDDLKRKILSSKIDNNFKSIYQDIIDKEIEKRNLEYKAIQQRKKEEKAKDEKEIAKIMLRRSRLESLRNEVIDLFKPFQEEQCDFDGPHLTLKPNDTFVD